MNENKLAAIRAAYGDAWEKVKEHVKSNAGWCEPGHETNFQAPIEREPYGTDRWRPVSLRGIEDNNGWIRCDERLPEVDQICNIFVEGKVYHTLFNGAAIRRMHQDELVCMTHWKLARPVTPPIY